jgi:hypothetical protein
MAGRQDPRHPQLTLRPFPGHVIVAANSHLEQATLA